MPGLLAAARSLSRIFASSRSQFDPQTGALVEEDRVVLVDTDEGLATSVTVSAEAAAAFVGMLDTACQVRGWLGDPEDVARLLGFSRWPHARCCRCDR